MVIGIDCHPSPGGILAFHKEHTMFIANVAGKEAVNTLAQQLGCKAGETHNIRTGYGRPGLIGNTFGIKDDLKARGARWDGENKAWTFADWASLEGALIAIIAK